jgi:hypothetical protein
MSADASRQLNRQLSALGSADDLGDASSFPENPTFLSGSFFAISHQCQHEGADQTHLLASSVGTKIDSLVPMLDAWASPLTVGYAGLCSMQ